MRIILLGTKMGSMVENPIYPMALVIFYWEHVEDGRENECRDVLYLYIELFDAKVDVSCSMKPSGNLLASCLEFSWLLVVFFVCQFVYRENLSVVWTTQNNIIAIFYPNILQIRLIISMAL
jgi:hypothetical protein